MAKFNTEDLFGRIVRRAFWNFCKIFPIRKNKVVVMSYYGRGYCDNPKSIIDEVLRQDLPYDIYWVIKDKNADNMLPNTVKPILIDTLSYVYHMTTARLWIDNSRKSFYGKREGQLYIQTWHGNHGLKNVEAACEDALEKGYVNNAKRDSQMSNLFLSNSGFLSDLYRKYFWYDGPIMEKGLPRNDILFRTDFDGDAVRKALHIPEGKKTVLYAPTFRANHSLEPYKLDCKRCAEALSRRFGEEWTVLIRLHPNIFEKADELQYDSAYSVNASAYPDIQDLYLIADALITDYSSVMFDYMYTKRPSFLFATDMDNYEDDRGFVLPLEELPLSIATDNGQLEENIQNFDQGCFEGDLTAFMEKTRVAETGKASEYVVEWIKENM